MRASARRPAEQLVLEPDTKIAQRRDTVLDLMANDRTPLSGTQYSPADLEAEKGKELELARQAAPLEGAALRVGGRGRARPQAVWAGCPDV